MAGEGLNVGSAVLGVLAERPMTRETFGHKTGDVMFMPIEFSRWENVVGKKVTYDTSCNREFADAVLMSPNVSPLRVWFNKSDCGGCHVWLDPPDNKLHQMISHYKECKLKAPTTTSACIVVPRWVGGSAWRRLLRGMRLLHEYPANTPLYVKLDENGEQITKPGYNYPIQIWYDPPAGTAEPIPGVVIEPWHLSDDGPWKRPKTSRSVGTLAGRQGLSMHFKGHLNSVPTDILMDSGAEGNWVMRDIADAAGAHFHPMKHSQPVELAGGLSTSVKDVCTLEVKIQGVCCRPSFYVLDHLPGGFGCILGDPWLTLFSVDLKHRPAGQSHAVFGQGGRCVTLYPVNCTLSMAACVDGAPHLAGEVPKVLSAMQFKRVVRKQGRHARVFAVVVKPAEAVTTSTAAAAAISPKWQALIDKHKSLFEPIPKGLPPDRGVGHVIPLMEGAQPPRKHMYRLSPREKEEVEKQIAFLLEQGWIEPRKSPFGAPILFAEKKDGGLRMCQDFRGVNKITLKDKHPIGRIDDLIESLHGAKWFSSLDLQAGYHQIRISEEDVDKTGFLTHQGQYVYRVLPFGLSNAPSTFARMMQKVLEPVLGKYVVVYLDDILIYSKGTEEEHMQHVENVMQLLEKAQLYCKLSKCTFGQKETKFLGHIVGADGIQVDPQKVSVLLNWPRPANVADVRSFLGLAVYFRKFVPHFSTIAHPLHKLLRAREPWLWTDACENAFNTLKTKLAEAPLLAMPNFDKDALPFEIICDASNVGVGAILTQGGRPIAYESRRLNPAEMNYHPGELELLAVVHAMRTFRCYVEGLRSVVITDHNPLVYLQTQPSLSRRQVRWSEYLQNFDFEWKYRPGANNPADPLSRLRTVSPVQLQCLLLLPTLRHKGKQRKAKRAVISSKKSSTRQSKRARTADRAESPTFLDRCRAGYSIDRTFADQKKGLGEDGLYRDKRGAVLVPAVDTLRMDILKEVHDTPYGGHLGAARTLELLTRVFTWPKVHADVEQFVKTCHVCQRDKSIHTGPKGLLNPLDIPERRWESVSMDFITGLPPTKKGNTQIVVYVDRLTKMVHLDALPTNTTAAAVAQNFVRNVFRLHGLPASLITDRDSKFTSHFWAELTRLLGTARHMSTAFRPQSDGQTERVNKVVEDMLRHWVNPEQDNWDTLLDCAEFAINNAYSESIKTTPFRLNYGQNPLTPLNLELESNMPYVRDFVREMKDTLLRAKKAIQAAQERQKAYYDRGRTEQVFEVGQEVLLASTNLNLKSPGAPKLLPKWVGPFTVLQRVGPLAYELDLKGTLPVHNVFHTSILKPFYSDGRFQPLPLPIVIEGQEWYEVQSVLDHRIHGNSVEYLIQWVGYGPEYNSWEPASGLAKAKERVAEYHNRVHMIPQKVRKQKSKRPPTTAV